MPREEETPVLPDIGEEPRGRLPLGARLRRWIALPVAAILSMLWFGAAAPVGGSFFVFGIAAATMALMYGLARHPLIRIGVALAAIAFFPTTMLIADGDAAILEFARLIPYAFETSMTRLANATGYSSTLDEVDNRFAIGWWLILWLGVLLGEVGVWLLRSPRVDDGASPPREEPADAPGCFSKTVRRLFPPNGRQRLWVFLPVVLVLVLLCFGVVGRFVRLSWGSVTLGDVLSGIRFPTWSIPLVRYFPHWLLIVGSVCAVTCGYVVARRFITRLVVIHLAVLLPILLMLLPGLGTSGRIAEMPKMVATAFTWAPSMWQGHVDATFYRQMAPVWISVGAWTILWMIILLGEVGAWFVRVQRGGAGVTDAA